MEQLVIFTTYTVSSLLFLHGVHHLIKIYIERQATGLRHVSVKDDQAGCKYGIIFSVHELSALWFSVWKKR